MKKLLLFDIDGTLLRSKGIGREAKRRAMLEMFGTESTVLTHPFGGKTDWGILAELLAPYGQTPQSLGDIMAEYELLMEKHMMTLLDDFTATPCPCAQELIAELRQREDIILGIVTGNVSKTAKLKLQLADFDPTWFPVGAYGNESYSRNDLTPLALQRAIAYCGYDFAGTDIIVIGDTPADVECTRVIDGIAVAVETGYASTDSLIQAEPDYLLPDLSTFIDCVLE